jgi:hypothetical protein
MNRRESQLAAVVAICLTAALICVACSLAVALRPQAQPAPRPAQQPAPAALFEQRLSQQVNDTATVNMQSAGAGATASVDGNDAVGQVNITTGSNPRAGSLVHITFRTPYATQPFVMLTPEDANPPAGWYVTIDQNGWNIVVSVPSKPNTNYPFAYLIAPRPWLMYPNGK